MRAAINAGRCENLSQLGPVARMPALSAQACRTVASATACVEIPTLDVHRLPCGTVASFLPIVQEPVFTLYGATTRQKLGAGPTPKSILIPRRPIFMLEAVELTEGLRVASFDARIQPFFCISFIDAQTLCQFGGYQYVAAGSRYETAACKSSRAKRAPEAVRLFRNMVYFSHRMLAGE